VRRTDLIAIPAVLTINAIKTLNTQDHMNLIIWKEDLNPDPSTKVPRKDMIKIKEMIRKKKMMIIEILTIVGLLIK